MFFAVSCPAPMKNRDFVIESSWLQTKNEFMIINHSVYHSKCPPKKGFVRGTSFLTGEPPGRGLSQSSLNKVGHSSLL